jgi:hypothetical protein
MRLVGRLAPFLGYLCPSLFLRPLTSIFLASAASSPSGVWLLSPCVFLLNVYISVPMSGDGRGAPRAARLLFLVLSLSCGLVRYVYRMRPMSPTSCSTVIACVHVDASTASSMRHPSVRGGCVLVAFNRHATPRPVQFHLYKSLHEKFHLYKS